MNVIFIPRMKCSPTVQIAWYRPAFLKVMRTVPVLPGVRNAVFFFGFENARSCTSSPTFLSLKVMTRFFGTILLFALKENSVPVTLTVTGVADVADGLAIAADANTIAASPSTAVVRAILMRDKVADSS